MTALKKVTAVCAVAALSSAGFVAGALAHAADPYPLVRFDNCATMHEFISHGVGKTGAVDKDDHDTPVTGFYVDDALYQANKGLDRDGDGIACEFANPTSFVKVPDARSLGVTWLTPTTSPSPSAPTSAKPSTTPSATALDYPLVTFANCDTMHRYITHGVGKPGAVDTGDTRVTDFYVNEALYLANKSLDRDGDGVACESNQVAYKVVAPAQGDAGVTFPQAAGTPGLAKTGNRR